MNIHIFQHVPYEGLGSLQEYFASRNARLSHTLFYAGDKLPPSTGSFDCLVVLGGPMSVSDTAEYPWLKEEIPFIRTAIDAGKQLLGICLGAQLIASALGAKISRNPHREIGWFPINRSEACESTILKDQFPESLEVFHWHGDTFELPAGATLLASSEACVNQGFILDNCVLGFQFHLETTPDSVASLIDNCGDELEQPGPYIQSPAEMQGYKSRFACINKTMANILDRFL